MSAEELVEAFSKVALEADRVMEANEEVEIAWTEEVELASTPKEGEVQDVKKTAEECEQKLEEVEGAVQRVLWQSFGYPELSLALEAAEKECERLEKNKSGLKLEVYELILSNLEGLVRVAKEAIRRWTRWVPDEERPDFQEHMRRVEGWLLDLISGKATLLQAKLENEWSLEGTPHRSPAIKLRPTAHPQFDGNK